MIYDIFYILNAKIAYVLLGLLAASIAGTLSYLIWLFLEKRTAKFHVTTAMLFLRMTLACFLVPVVPFIIFAFRKDLELGGEVLQVLTPMAVLILVVVPICLFSLVMISIVKYWNYRKKLYLCRDNVPVEEERYLVILEKWCQKLEIRKKVQLSINEEIQSPAILYYKGYQIMMPAYITDEREFSMALLHELVHLKHGDLRTKQIGSIANVLHAFNPVIYKLRDDIERWTEVDCDLTTCETGKGEFDRREYFKCLLSLRDRSQEAVQLKEMCGLAENQSLIVFRVDAMSQLKRDEMKKPVTGYLLAFFLLVLLTVGSFAVSSSVYRHWFKWILNYKQEKLDDVSPELSTMEMFAGTEIVYSNEKIFDRDDSFNFTIDAKETWFFDVSDAKASLLFLNVRCDGHYFSGCILENGKITSLESDGNLADRLKMENSMVKQIFIQNPEDEPIDIELLAGKGG